MTMCAGRNCLLAAEPGSTRCGICGDPTRRAEADLDRSWLVAHSRAHYGRVVQDAGIELGLTAPIKSVAIGELPGRSR